MSLPVPTVVSVDFFDCSPFGPEVARLQNSTSGPKEKTHTTDAENAIFRYPRQRGKEGWGGPCREPDASVASIMDDGLSFVHSVGWDPSCRRHLQHTQNHMALISDSLTPAGQVLDQ